MKRLTTVRNPIEATLLQHTLENEGIASFTTNEHTSVILPHFYGMLGHGIQVMVRDSDYERAQQVLAQKQEEGNITKCPDCGSPNIEFGKCIRANSVHSCNSWQ